MDQQGLPKSTLDHQASMKTQSEDQDLVKNRLLMPSQDPSQPPQCADPSERQLAQLQEEAQDEISVKEAPKLASPTSQMVEQATTSSQECQQQVPFLKLLYECEEKLGIKDPSQKSTLGTFPPPDHPPERKAAFKE